MKSQCYKTCQAVLLAAAVLTAPAAFATSTANSIRFDFGPPGAPALTALFQDAAPGTVQLTINALALSGENSINSICFNFDPAFDAKDLTFTQTGSVGGVSGMVSSANDSYKVSGGSGKFDIDFIFGPDFQTGDYRSIGLIGGTVLDLGGNQFTGINFAFTQVSGSPTACGVEPCQFTVTNQSAPTFSAMLAAWRCSVASSSPRIVATMRSTDESN